MQIDLLGQRTVSLTDDEATTISAEVDALGAVDAIRGSAPDGQTLVVNDENVVVIVRSRSRRNSYGSFVAADEARDSLLRYAALTPWPTGSVRGSSRTGGANVLELYGLVRSE